MASDQVERRLLDPAALAVEEAELEDRRVDRALVNELLHATTVERLIGLKRGTGGTGGVQYLRKMLEVVLFPELWRLRTDL